MAEKRLPRWVDEPMPSTSPPDDIFCKTCEYRMPSIELSSGETFQRYKHGSCSAFKYKPHDILFEGAECPFYKEDKEAILFPDL